VQTSVLIYLKVVRMSLGYIYIYIYYSFVNAFSNFRIYTYLDVNDIIMCLQQMNCCKLECKCLRSVSCMNFKYGMAL
jgi:hypothetical protein